MQSWYVGVFICLFFLCSISSLDLHLRIHFAMHAISSSESHFEAPCTFGYLASASLIAPFQDCHQALFSYLHPCTWGDLALDLAEPVNKADYQRHRLQSSMIEMLFIFQVLAPSLHYIITVFWGSTGCG